jgi:hypothetical protein
MYAGVVLVLIGMPGWNPTPLLTGEHAHWPARLANRSKLLEAKTPGL